MGELTDSPNAESGAGLLACDGKPGCPVTVWDGPYSFRCSLGAERGKCAYHGSFATPTSPETSAP